MNSLMQTLEVLVNWINLILVQNPSVFLIVASFITINIAMYFFTRGKEFCITGYAFALFLIPLIKFS